MEMKTIAIAALTIASLELAIEPVMGQDKMPRENVIHSPAIGEGPLSVHNLFQDNMVLQRGKDLSWTGSFCGIGTQRVAR